MLLHFYASIDTVNGIQQGYEMFVHAKEDIAPFDAIQVSFDLKKYSVKKDVNSKSLFLVKKK